MGHNSVVSGHLKSTGISRVNELSTGPPDLGCHTFIIWGENKEDDLESILSFDSEMSSVYCENDYSSLENDTE